MSKIKLLTTCLAVMMSLGVTSCNQTEKNIDYIDNEITAQTETARSIAIKMLGSGTNGQGYPWKSFTYTLSPADSLATDIEVSVYFADNRNNASSYLTATHDSSTKTVTVTCLQPFDSYGYVHLESAYSSSVYANVQIGYTAKYSNGLLNSEITLGYNSSLFNALQASWVDTVSLNTEGVTTGYYDGLTPGYAGDAFAAESNSAIESAVLPTFTKTLTSSSGLTLNDITDTTNISVFNGHDTAKNCLFNAMFEAFSEWINYNNTWFGTARSMDEPDEEINLAYCFEKKLRVAVNNYSLSSSEYEVIRNFHTANSNRLVFKADALISITNISFKIAKWVSPSIQTQTISYNTGWDLDKITLTSVANPAYSSFTAQSISPETNTINF